MNDTTALIEVQPFTVTLLLECLELRLTLPKSLDLRLSAQGEYTCTHSGFNTLEPPVLHQLENFAVVLADILGWRNWSLHPEDHFPGFLPSPVYGLSDHSDNSREGHERLSYAKGAIPLSRTECVK